MAELVECFNKYNGVKGFIDALESEDFDFWCEKKYGEATDCDHYINKLSANLRKIKSRYDRGENFNGLTQEMARQLLEVERKCKQSRQEINRQKFFHYRVRNDSFLSEVAKVSLEIASKIK